MSNHYCEEALITELLDVIDRSVPPGFTTFN